MHLYPCILVNFLSLLLLPTPLLLLSAVNPFTLSEFQALYRKKGKKKSFQCPEARRDLALNLYFQVYLELDLAPKLLPIKN